MFAISNLRSRRSTLRIYLWEYSRSVSIDSFLEQRPNESFKDRRNPNQLLLFLGPRLQITTKRQYSDNNLSSSSSKRGQTRYLARSRSANPLSKIPPTYLGSPPRHSAKLKMVNNPSSNSNNNNKRMHLEEVPFSGAIMQAVVLVLLLQITMQTREQECLVNRKRTITIT